MSRLIISFQHTNVTEPMPWPIGLTDENVVTSGLGNDDGSLLIGFGAAGSQSVDVYVEDARENPASVVGLVPTFSREGKFFEWSLPVAELAVIEADPEAGRIPIESLYAAEHQRRMAEEA